MNPPSISRPIRSSLLLATAALAGSGTLPAQDFATFLGGSGYEEPMAMALDDQDRIVIVGLTDSTDFPVTTGSSHGGSEDAFVAIVDATVPRIVFAQYLGGTGRDIALDVDYSPAQGLITVVGITNSLNFPTTRNASQPNLSGGYDGFVTQLDLSGQVVYSTYLGTTGTDRLGAVRAHSSSTQITVAGFTNSANLPVTAGAYQPRLAGNYDAFVAHLDLPPGGTAQLVAATYLGGTGAEGWFCSNCLLIYWDLVDLDVSASGAITVASATTSPNFPTTPGAYQGSPQGGYDVFVSRLDPGLSQLLDSTYIGSAQRDIASVLEVHAPNLVTIAGLSTGAFPTTTGAPQTSRAGGQEGYVARLDWSQTGNSQLAYSTLVSSAATEGIWGLAVESSGIITACGYTGGTPWPATPGAPQPVPLGQGTGSTLRLEPKGNGWNDVHYFSYFGAGALQPDFEWLHRIDVRADGRVAMVGGTDNPNFLTTPNAPQPTHAGGQTDVVIAVLDLLPTGVRRYGTSSPSCHPQITMQVNSDPWRGNTCFELHCNHAPSNTPGMLLLGLQKFTPSVTVLGAELLTSPDLTLWAGQAGANGFARSGCIPIPTWLPVNPGLFVQWIWQNPGVCNGALLAGSDALEIL